MIELAPHRKQGLAIGRAVLAASGALGFGGAAGDGLALDRFGAIVTAPISLRPRRGSAPPRLVPLPGGMLLQTGEQNAGWRRVAELHAGAWARSRVPLIAHIIGQTSLGELARRAEGTRGIAGLEFDLLEMEALPLLAALRRATELPLLARLPYGGAGLAQRAVEAGADALVCIAPPRGMAQTVGSPLGRSAGPATQVSDASARELNARAVAAEADAPSVSHALDDDARRKADGAQFVAGSLFGPLVRALALQTLRAVRAELAGLEPAVPLIACGGVHSADDVEELLAAGASAVMVDSLAWVAPAKLNALLALDYGQSK